MPTIDNIKTIYDIEILNYQGLTGIIKKIVSYKYLILFIVLFLSIIVFLSHVIFSVDIITNDKKMERKIRYELTKEGLTKYKFKKNYYQLQKIKKHVLRKYKHNIDWIEIENIGSKYIVRYEPRIENSEKKELPFRNIIAKKNAIVYSLDISSGEIIKQKNSYVHKDEVIVSGYIHLNDNIVKTVSSKGKVMGEVWYTLTINYPLKQQYEYKTGNKNNVYVLKLISKDHELFNFHKYKNCQKKNKTIFKNNLLPVIIEKQTQYETNKIDKLYNKKEAIKRAIQLGKKKLNKKILTYKVLNSEVSDKVLKVKIFYTVLEDITSYQTIEEYKDDITN